VDETGSNLSMTRLYGRARVGERSFDKVPRNHGVNLTVVGAIALDGVRAMMAYEGGTTLEAFLRFVNEALVPSLHPGDIVVMDNLRVHHNDEVKATIKAAGADVLFLPPYSPELNPIELTWSKLKAILRKVGARTLRTLAAAVSYSTSRVSLGDLAGWFRHCGYANQRE
jgi:transposase